MHVVSKFTTGATYASFDCGIIFAIFPWYILVELSMHIVDKKRKHTQWSSSSTMMGNFIGHTGSTSILG